MKITTLILILLLAVSCCKEPEFQVGNSFIGTWSVVQIDSVRNTFSNFTTIHEYSHLDTVVFNRDSTGFFSIGLYPLSRDQKEFAWSHDRLYNMLRIDFENGSTEAYIKKLIRDEIEIYIWDYLGPFYVGARVAYYLKLEKTY